MQQHTNVLMVISQACENGALLALARHRHWEVLHEPTPVKVLRHINLCRAQVLIVEVIQQVDDALRLIRAVREHRRHVRVVATCQLADHALELAVRGLGVSCFLVSPDETAVCRAVGSAGLRRL